MKKSLSLILLVMLLSITVVGCAAIKKAVNETTPAQVATMQNTITPYTNAIPLPFVALGAPLLAILAAVGKNWWDDKHAPKPPTA